MYVADGGSDESFLLEAERSGACVITHGDMFGEGSSRLERRVFASELSFMDGSDFVIWAEPEKVSLVEHIDDIISCFISSGSRIGIIGRSGFENDDCGYPGHQAESERVLNDILNIIISNTGANIPEYEKDPRDGLIYRSFSKPDLSFGPRIMDRAGFEIFRQYCSDYYKKYGRKWEPWFTPLIDALKGNNGIASIRVPFRYPREQTDIEIEHYPQYMMIKRIYQRIAILMSFARRARDLNIISERYYETIKRLIGNYAEVLGYQIHEIP